MGRSMLIAGVERWQDYERGSPSGGSLVIEQGLTYTSDACSFDLRGAAPNTGDTVMISEDGTDLYGGVIVKVGTITRADKTVYWAVECDDFSTVLSRHQVVEIYEAQTAAYIIADIITKYVDAEFTSSIPTGSPTIERIVFDYVAVSEAFKQICDYVGWSWIVTPAKVITFFDPQTLLTPAPIVIEPGALFTNMKYSVDTSSLRNRVYIKGGAMPSDTLTYEWKADGVADKWALPFTIHSVSAFTVGGAAATYGEENVVDEDTVDYVYHVKDQSWRCADGTGIPASGTVMHLEYKRPIDIITWKDDLSSQAAIGAIQGNDGVYEYVITDTSLITLEAAEAAGEADIKEFGNPKTTGSFDTNVTGWAPGQIVRINLPLRGIDSQFMVQTVKMQARPGSGWDVTVGFGGRLLGVANWLAALINDQKSAKVSDTSTIAKYVHGDEKPTITDTLITAAQTVPYMIEDCFCGKVATT